eukprot:1009082-Pyramimonas_sp.AAC.3
MISVAACPACMEATLPSSTVLEVQTPAGRTIAEKGDPATGSPFRLTVILCAPVMVPVRDAV